MIGRNVPHHLLLNDSQSAFHIACCENNIFIVKRVHEILESLNFDIIQLKNILCTILNVNDMEVIEYLLSIDGIKLNICHFLEAIKSLKFARVVYLLNFFLRQSIPSHLRNQFHIFQFVNHPLNTLMKTISIILIILIMISRLINILNKYWIEMYTGIIHGMKFAVMQIWMLFD